MNAMRRALEQLSFDNTYARLPEAFYAKLNPTPFGSPPYLIHANHAAAELIDLDPEQLTRPEFVGVFGGSLLVPGMEPLAMLYAGHQFGVYVPQLGDGRAILLGEAVNDRDEKWDLHLKGAGMTPFSRDGDGRAVLRSTIREYLCSEARAGHPDDAGALPRRQRREGLPRAGGNRRDARPHGADACPLRHLRGLLLPEAV